MAIAFIYQISRAYHFNFIRRFSQLCAILKKNTIFEGNKNEEPNKKINVPSSSFFINILNYSMLRQAHAMRIIRCV
jgi:hypothetical protein